MGDMHEHVILGNPFLAQEKVVLDYARGCMYLEAKDRQTMYWRHPNVASLYEIKLPDLDETHPAYLAIMLDEFNDIFEIELQQTTTP